MGSNLVTGLVTIATSIVGLAIIATLVSKNANTSGVIQSAGSALSGSIATAVSPVTGGSGFGGGMTMGTLPSLTTQM